MPFRARALALAWLLALPFGTAVRAEEGGSVGGRVFDAASGAPLEAVTVVLTWPGPEGSAAPREDVQSSDEQGSFRFAGLAPGTYRLGFTRAGYRSSTLDGVVVAAGKLSRADFPLPPLPPETSDQVLELEAFVVEASVAEEGADVIELRIDADQLVNTLSAAELSKFAASDVAEALKRVAGVNVVGGQFAIIRGLEDRYNSTLYNSAPVPSPDPDKQSVQLDLFPSDVVGDLVVSKTFVPDLPSNSSGGALDIVTHEHPETFELKFTGGSGWNQNAWDRFLGFEDGSPIGTEEEGSDTLESDYGLRIGGRREVEGRELRFKGVLNQEIDFETREGFEEELEPRASVFRRIPRPGRIVQSGDLALGELNLTAGRFDLVESERSEQKTAYLGLGLDLDEKGNHRIDASTFFTRKEEEVVQQGSHGYLPGFDYGTLARKQQQGLEIDANADFDRSATLSSWIARSVRGSELDPPSRGPLWYASFSESDSFERERELEVYQANGEHRFERIPGLRLAWASNHSKTRQEESSLGTQFFYEPDDVARIPDVFPVTPGALGPGRWFANDGILSSSNDIREDQDFGRFDLEWERELSDPLRLVVKGGGWFERASRDVSSSFLESPTLEGSSQFAIAADSPEELGEAAFDELDRTTRNALSGLRETENESSREIDAWSGSAKATLWERLDLLAGIRRESIFIESLNAPFTGELAFDGSPGIFPTKYLFFDRLDNPARSEVVSAPPPGTTYNDQLLGLSVPVDPATGLVDLVDLGEIDSLVNGRIDEKRSLPSLGVAIRPLEGLALRGAWSKTVARPSFREMGYYVSVEPGSDDLIVGNPQLVLSDVKSWDARIEWVRGTRGDLVAASWFSKKIEDPIESIIIRNPLNVEGSSSALFRTFFNNPSTASLEGWEVEARKGLGFLGLDFLEHLSLGGNATWIDATVERTEAELARSGPFFGTAAGDAAAFSSLEEERRLFGQPEWIFNADLTFEHPDWGTRVTLAWFSISDVLDAAGSASIDADGRVRSFTLDRYVDSFDQLDLVASQTWHVDVLRGDLTLKASLKNLTDSTRRRLYDPEQTRGTFVEREFKVGRDYSFSFSYSFSF